MSLKKLFKYKITYLQVYRGTRINIVWIQIKIKHFQLGVNLCVCEFLCKTKCTLSMSNTRKTNCTVNLFMSAQEIHILFFIFFYLSGHSKISFYSEGNLIIMFLFRRVAVFPRRDLVPPSRRKYEIWFMKDPTATTAILYTPTAKANNPYGVYLNGRGTESWLWSID